MSPLSPRLLMQRGRPKTDRLGRIRSLDLSGLDLLSEDLDPKLLSRLKLLQELDLSNNQLETLPADLGLAQLRILRCANNQLGDVTALCQFPHLEELSLEGNPFLTVSDNLKVAFLLPKLRKVNGKDASSTSSQVENLNRELTSRVTAYWEKFMATLSPEEEVEKAQADFVRSAVRDVRYGPASLSEFTQWRVCPYPTILVQMISEELLASGGIQVPEADITERPPKATAAQKPRVRPVALKRPDNVPLSLSPNKRVCPSPLAQVEGSPTGSDGSQPALKLEPLHFLQCHSKNNSPQDLETQLWGCAFEPAWEDGHAGATSQTVATCGGEAVCVIDCQTGIVLHKYKAPGEVSAGSVLLVGGDSLGSWGRNWEMGFHAWPPTHQEFFSVAWTALMVVTQAGHKKRWSVLAAAGLRGVVRLLHVRAGFCCGVIRAHKKAIATLCFSPTHETHLFTASYDKRIILWDIGVPNHEYEFQARVYEVEFVFSEGSDASGRRVDGLAFVNEDVVASKGNGLGTICLWSWSQTWGRRGRQSTVAVVVLVRLQWSSTTLAYFSLSACPDEGILLCGDEEGSVWIYDIRRTLLQQPPRPAAPQAPVQILKWPQPQALGETVTKTMVNTVVANPTLTYLTALTDSNIVAIWKRQ
ncbi:hypothetical protein MC885_010222 [Smutsia gigantea]|nr:hypothetical protein MC885_010222 [Smutsia gigantea]